MTTRRTNQALSTTRRWTAGALLASTLAVGGLGLHLADAYAATQSGTVVAATPDVLDPDLHRSHDFGEHAHEHDDDHLDTVHDHVVVDHHLVRVDAVIIVLVEQRARLQLVHHGRHDDEGLMMTDAPIPAPGTTHTFHAIGCDHAVLVTDPAALAPAARLAEELVAALDLAASRFRPDSEVSRLAEHAAHADVTAMVSPLLGGCIEAALHAADITDGLVDPTVGRAVAASGYDADLAVVRRRAADGQGSPARITSDPAAVPGWRAVAYDPATRSLTVPRGTLLDLGATAKAYAADLIAERLAAVLPGGFLVNLGGDIAVSGTVPDQGWEIGVEDHLGVVSQVVVSTGQAVATSSTQVRTWTQGGEPRHHVVDPRTGRTAPAVWALVSCAGVTAVEANAASTAAIVLGADAPDWLEGHGIPARLDHAAPPAGTATVVHVDTVVTTPGWPVPERHAA